jgi:hypothetical protein
MGFLGGHPLLGLEPGCWGSPHGAGVRGGLAAAYPLTCIQVGTRGNPVLCLAGLRLGGGGLRLRPPLCGGMGETVTRGVPTVGSETLARFIRVTGFRLNDGRVQGTGSGRVT